MGEREREREESEKTLPNFAIGISYRSLFLVLNYPVNLLSRMKRFSQRRRSLSFVTQSLRSERST